MLSACSSTPHEQPVEKRNEAPLSFADFEEIQERGRIVLLTENTSVSFYLYRGQALGYDYEMVQAFANAHGLKVEVRILDDLNQMFDILNRGEGDIIACNLNITDERSQYVAFTKPLFQTSQVLVQQKSLENDVHSGITSWADLEGQEVYVHHISTAYRNLRDTLERYHINCELIDPSGNLTSERLIKLVADGQIAYTIADENLAKLNATYYDNLDISLQVSQEQEVGWAVRLDADSLQHLLNDFLTSHATQRKRSYLHHKYFTAVKSQQQRVRSLYSSLDGKRISDYDDAIRRYSRELLWDWRLLAAMIYSESRFNPEAKSWAGAFGLMQLMPNTAERFGIDTTHTRESNIRAGVAYLKYLDKYWRKHIDDREERVNFVLASYNVGPGHVQDARVIARERGKDPNRWFNNVDECLLLKSDPEFKALEGVKHGYCRGSEPVNYVSNVRRKFGEYLAFE